MSPSPFSTRKSVSKGPWGLPWAVVLAMAFIALISIIFLGVAFVMGQAPEVTTVTTPVALGN